MSDSLKEARETVLVVDDDESVLTMVVAVLQHANFRVISANSGPSAVTLSERTEGRIDLLLTEWDMPEMSGIALGQALKIARPDIYVMQMAGGAHDSLMVLNYGWAYLQKPLLALKLAEMVADVLHSPNREQLGGKSFDSRLDNQPEFRSSQRS